MSTRPAIGVGGIVGGAVAFVVVTAIVASPIYLSPLRSSKAILDSTVEGHIEEVRRVILNLDENLALMNTVAARSEIKGDGARGTPSISKDLMDMLNQSSSALSELERTDADRNTQLEVGTVQSGAPRAPANFESEYLAKHKALLTDADKAIRELNSSAASLEPNASNHLGANRIQAILEYARGQIERNRAEFEAWQAAEHRRAAMDLVSSATALQRVARSLASESPDEVIKSTAAQIEYIEQNMAARKSVVAGLTQAIGESEARIQELEGKASAARRRMAELEHAGAAIHDPAGEYATLSKDARDAESELDALRNGTLAGASRKNTDVRGDLLATEYEGGQARLGVRDLQDRLDLLNKEIAGLEKSRDALNSRRAELAKHRDALRTQAKASSDEADAQLVQIGEVLAKAEQHADAAVAASDAAIKAMTQANAWAKKAAINAGNIKTDMQNIEAPEGSSLAELKNMVREDGDTQASATCISAESNFIIALLRAQQIEWLNSHQQALAAIADRTGRDAPADISDRIDNIRRSAIDNISDAKKDYEKAAKEIATTSATVDGLRIQGKDHKWQIQIAQAAVHLLSGVLATTDTERHAEQDAAYELLKEAIQGREQSPALQKAIRTVQLLQQTAR